LSALRNVVRTVDTGEISKVFIDV